MIFSNSDLENLISVDRDQLTWAVFKSIEPGDRYEWYLYDRSTHVTPAGLPVWSVLSDSDYKRDRAVEQAKMAYEMAIKFLDEGAYWNVVDSLPDPDPEPEPEPEPEPKWDEEDPHAVRRLAELVEEEVPPVVEEDDLEDWVSTPPVKRGLFSRKTAPYNVH